MEINADKILSLLIKKSFFIVFLLSILLLFAVSFLYLQYLYSALNFQPQFVVENKIEDSTLDKVTKNINKREGQYLKSLKSQYPDPFR
ncbi:MAG: hypothetical protein V1841_00190 [Patescibacteria group bacterium]